MLVHIKIVYMNACGMCGGYLYLHAPQNFDFAFCRSRKFLYNTDGIWAYMYLMMNASISVLSLLLEDMTLGFHWLLQEVNSRNLNHDNRRCLAMVNGS